jgi:DNA-binding IclR family transcriptional regulator
LIDADVATFIRGSVRSVWALELLLFLRQRRSQRWTEEALVRELRASRTLVQQGLATFESAGLLSQNESSWTYSPASSALDALCETLEREYRERPVAIVNAIAESPDEKLKTFADAFRFKGKPK